MELFKIMAYCFLLLYLCILLSSIFVYLLNKPWFKWVVNSIDYPFRLRRMNKLFDKLNDTQKRDMWLDNVLTMDDSKWYYRALEKHIREKYIEQIVSTYGTV